MSARRWSRIVFSLACLLASLAVARGQVADPLLDVDAIDDETFELFWDAAATDWVMEQSSNLTFWNTVLKAPQLDGGRIVLALEFPAGVPQLWFRLRAQKTSGVAGGLNFLRDSQLIDGSWGPFADTMLRDTAAAIEALLLIPDYESIADAGVAGIGLKPVRNNDDLARLTLTMARAAADVSSLVEGIIDVENITTTDTAFAAFPGGGWGLARGFDNSTIDTALCLRALKRAGVPTGLSVVNESIPLAGSSPAHAFEVPAGATAMVLSVRALTGNARFNLHVPGGGTSFVNLTPGSVPTNINFGTPAAGTWSLSVDNNAAGAIAYSAEVSFTTAGGVDVGGFTAAATYLGLNQNLDGGWSAIPEADSHLMITFEVMKTLSECGDSFQGAINAGASWLFNNKKNGDGGFSSEPPASNVQETALAVLAIRLSNLGLNIADSILFLKNAQLLNGSWGEDPYLTAIAALAVAQPPVVSPIPGQAVVDPAPFAMINLDDFVDDPDHADNQITWTVSGNTQLGVSIVNRVATITYPAATEISEDLTFKATDPDGLSDASTATFSVSLTPLVDHTIPRGGFATGTRFFTTTPANFSQITQASRRDAVFRHEAT